MFLLMDPLWVILQRRCYLEKPFKMSFGQPACVAYGRFVVWRIVGLTNVRSQIQTYTHTHKYRVSQGRVQKAPDVQADILT